MCWKNFMIWKKKLKILINKSINYLSNNVALLFEAKKKYRKKNAKVVKTKNGKIGYY